ncbi:unnamed protein product [Gordionus sp. m RMFG-2023]|uniref:regulation of nuclear pre-mRNA domain-containing protein 1B-like n=1 Tax=Gordionus sp. m RMFG-2023 TaxID=3053472 RepID=UPI0030E4BD56
MSHFSESSLEKKLKDLNTTQQSIQTLSLWIIHHKKYAKLVVQIWHREIYNAKDKKRIILLYLANDIIQNGRKKAPDYAKEFKIVLPIAITTLIKDLDENNLSKVRRVLQIWRERSIYDNEFIDQLKEITENSKSTNNEPKKVKFTTSPTIIKDDKILNEAYDIEDDLDFVMTELEEMHETSKNDNITIPPVEDIIKMLNDLENAASSDAVVREKISKLPSRVSDTSALDKIQDIFEIETLEAEIDGALDMLNVYNDRLSQELDERKWVSLILKTYLDQQTKLVGETEDKIKFYRDKLKKVNATRLELQLHLDRLPDFDILPPGLINFTNEDIFSSLFNNSSLKLTSTSLSTSDEISKHSTKSSNLKSIDEIQQHKYFVSPTISEDSDTASLENSHNSNNIFTNQQNSFNSHLNLSGKT